jgi:hypothetical protein
VAWIAPFAVFAAALLGTILLVRRWSTLSVGKSQAAGPHPTMTIPPTASAEKKFAGKPAMEVLSHDHPARRNGRRRS